MKIFLTKGCSTSDIKLAQEENENKKQDFNLDLEKASSSNTTLFLSFQIAHNKQIGTALSVVLMSDTTKKKSDVVSDDQKLSVGSDSDDVQNHETQIEWTQLFGLE